MKKFALCVVLVGFMSLASTAEARCCRFPRLRAARHEVRAVLTRVTHPFARKCVVVACKCTPPTAVAQVPHKAKKKK